MSPPITNRSRPLELAIQVHPHDVRHEGAPAVVDNILERAGLTTIIAETGTLEERHPYPRGVLPHDPRHQVVFTKATLEVPLPRGAWNALPVRPRLSATARAGDDFFADLSRAGVRQGVTVLPWVKALNGAVVGRTEDVCVQTCTGEAVPTWLCPNRPATEEYVWRLLQAILESYEARAVLLDRLRYPDWSGRQVSLDRLLTCFCPACRSAMAEAGIDVEGLRTALLRLRSLAGSHLSSLPLPSALPGGTADLVVEWLAFRRQSITRLAASLAARLAAWRRVYRPELRFWLNLWPPAFAGLLGQDYGALGRLCDGAKHFPYHRLGGGADLAGLVRAVAVPEAHEKFFALLLELLDLPYRPSFVRFQADGFPPEFVSGQTAAARAAFGATPVYTGIQIWDLPPEEIDTAVAAAKAGGADGLFFYCYGWATLEALDRVGRLVRP